MARGKQQCPQGSDCPYKHEHQHTQEFNHDRPAPTYWEKLGDGGLRLNSSSSRAARASKARALSDPPSGGGSGSGGSADACRVMEIKVLERAGKDEVLAVLKKIAWQVQPIMIRRGWSVGVLLELKPEGTRQAGDNMNRGQRVRLKVRRPAGGVEDYDHVLLVMLHELCHNKHDKHSDAFYKLLDEITEVHLSLHTSAHMSERMPMLCARV